MRYLSWQINWVGREGTDPTSVVNNDNTRIEPQFNCEDNSKITYYGYLVKGDIDLSQLSLWDTKEITFEEMYNAALKVDKNVTANDGGIIFPRFS